jgi:hypothetical protein
VPESWSVHGCLGSLFEDIVAEDFEGGSFVTVTGKPEMHAAQSSAGDSCTCLQFFSAKVSFGRGGDTPEYMLIEVGEGTPVMSDEIGVNVLSRQ